MRGAMVRLGRYGLAFLAAPLPAALLLTLAGSYWLPYSPIFRHKLSGVVIVSLYYTVPGLLIGAPLLFGLRNRRLGWRAYAAGGLIIGLAPVAAMVAWALHDLGRPPMLRLGSVLVAIGAGGLLSGITFRFLSPQRRRKPEQHLGAVFE